MHATRRCPTTHGALRVPLILPSRPNLEVVLRRFGLPRRADIEGVPRLAAHRAIRCIAPAILLFLAPIAVPTAYVAPAAAVDIRQLDPSDQFVAFVAEASDRFAIPATWICAVIHIESGGDARATSSRGAIGLMQIMPGTWVELSVRYRLGIDPYDPRDNILAGTAYLREMYDRFGSAGFLAAYHAGPLRYEQHLAAGRPLPPETVDYVVALTPWLGSGRTERDAFRPGRAVPWPEAPLFVERMNATSIDDRSAVERQRTSQPNSRFTVGLSTLTPPAADLFVRPKSEAQSR